MTVGHRLRMVLQGIYYYRFGWRLLINEPWTLPDLAIKWDEVINEPWTS